jgi:hypothetical protein
MVEMVTEEGEEGEDEGQKNRESSARALSSKKNDRNLSGQSRSRMGMIRVLSWLLVAGKY